MRIISAPPVLLKTWAPLVQLSLSGNCSARMSCTLTSNGSIVAEARAAAMGQMGTAVGRVSVTDSGVFLVLEVPQHGRRTRKRPPSLPQQGPTREPPSGHTD